MPTHRPFMIIEYDPQHPVPINKRQLHERPSKEELLDRLSSLENYISNLLNFLIFNGKRSSIEGGEDGFYERDGVNKVFNNKHLAIRNYIIWVLTIVNERNIKIPNQQTKLIKSNIYNINKSLNSIGFSLYDFITEHTQVSPLDPLLKRNKSDKDPFDPNNFGEVIQNGLLVVEENYFVYNRIFSKGILVASIGASVPNFFSYVSLCLLVFSSNVASINYNSDILNQLYMGARLMLPEVYANPKLDDLGALLFFIGLSFFLCDYQQKSKATSIIVRIACMLNIHEVDLNLVTEQSSIEEVKDLVIKRKLWELICNRVIASEASMSAFPSLLSNIRQTDSQLDLIQKLEKKLDNLDNNISYSLELFSELDLRMGKMVFNILKFVNSKLASGIVLETFPPNELRLPKHQLDEAQNFITSYLSRYYQPEKYQFNRNLHMTNKPAITLMNLPINYHSNFKFLKPVTKIISIFNLQIYLIYPSAFIHPVPTYLSISEHKTLLDTAFNQTHILFVICYIFFQTIHNRSYSHSQINAKNLKMIENFIKKYPEPLVQIELKQLNLFNLKAIQISDSSAYIFCYLNALSSSSFLLAHHPCSPILADLKSHIIVLLEIIAIFNHFENSQDRIDVDRVIASLDEYVPNFLIGPDFNIEWDYYLS